MGINFQKFKQGQNFDTTTEVNLSKNAKMGKQLWMGQFWPKILFFSWVPSFGSYIDDQNLNGPLGLKRADSGCPCPYGLQQPESPCFRFFHQYATQIKALMKKNKIFGQNWLINSCFPILKGCPDLFGHIFSYDIAKIPYSK